MQCHFPRTLEIDCNFRNRTAKPKKREITNTAATKIDFLKVGLFSLRKPQQMHDIIKSRYIAVTVSDAARDGKRESTPTTNFER